VKVLWVYAHPEPRSLNGSLKTFALETLARAGGETQLSDLYAMKWNGAAGPDDFPQRDRSSRMQYMAASREAYESGTQSAEIEAEQKKLLWCDVVVLQFPLWWFSMPAILKGWVDRVFANGLAYGLTDAKWPGRSGRPLRYGDGVFQGRRAMLLVTTAGSESAMGSRGISGNIHDLLFPINHGILWYAGFTVVPPFLVLGTRDIRPERYNEITQALEKRLLEIARADPIPYRKQNAGDYDDGFELKPGLEGDSQGFGIHLRQMK
jgi:NAD(P)H dehydrogenase (quinone)